MPAELIELNEILAEIGEPATTLEELERAGISLVPVREVFTVENIEVMVVWGS